MAKTFCIHNHLLSNSDGKPTIWVFKFNFLLEYEKEHPDTILGDDFMPYDATENVPGEDLNCWFCDNCGNFIVFLMEDWNNEVRYDYIPIIAPSHVLREDCHEWDEYFALRDDEFEKFTDSIDGLTISEMLNKYKDLYPSFMLSPDKGLIHSFKPNGLLNCSYKLERKMYLNYDGHQNILDCTPWYYGMNELDIKRRRISDFHSLKNNPAMHDHKRPLDGVSTIRFLAAVMDNTVLWEVIPSLEKWVTDGRKYYAIDIMNQIQKMLKELYPDF